MRATRTDLDRSRRPQRDRREAPSEPVTAPARRASIADFDLSLGASPLQLAALDSGVSAVHAALTRAPVQCRDGSPDRSADVHALAARGTAGSGGALPHVARIQAAFGRHDVSRVRAHQDSAAMAASRAMGARAYASGDHVAFAGGADLFTAAHEATHIVQQRGGVQLSGGVGRAGDAYEQHADRVAAEVVRGASVEHLLDTAAPGARDATMSARSVQRADGPAAPAPEPNPDYAKLAATTSKASAIAAVNALVAQGYTPDDIKTYAEQRAAQDTGWKRRWAEIQAGRWIVVRNDDDSEKWSLVSNAKDGLTWADASTRVAGNIVGEGGTASVSHRGDATAVKVDAAGGAYGQAGGQGSAKVKVTDRASNESLEIGAGYKGDGAAHDGNINVVVSDGERSLNVSGNGGTDTKGRGQGRTRAKYTSPDLSAGGSVGRAGDGHVSGDAAIDAGGVTGELSGGHGGDRSAVAARSTFKVGDRVKVSLAGNYYRRTDAHGGGGAAAFDVDTMMKGAGFEYANNTNGAVSVHTVKLNGGTWELGGDQKLGVKGTITIPDDNETSWRVESELVLVAGPDQITLKGTFGDAKINDLGAVAHLAPEHQAAHALFSAAAGHGDVKGQASAIVAVSEDEMLLGLGGSVTIGGRSNGQHDIKFLYNALGNDKFRHYATLAYSYLKEDFKVGASGSIDVKPTDKGYERLYKLQTSVGFSVAPGHMLRFEFGLAKGTHLALTAGAEWDWEGVMKVSLKSEFNLDDAEDLSFLLRVTPSNSDRFEVYLGYRDSHKIDNWGAYDGGDAGAITGGVGVRF